MGKMNPGSATNLTLWSTSAIIFAMGASCVTVRSELREDQRSLGQRERLERSEPEFSERHSWSEEGLLVKIETSRTCTRTVEEHVRRKQTRVNTARGLWAEWLAGGLLSVGGSTVLGVRNQFSDEIPRDDQGEKTDKVSDRTAATISGALGLGVGVILMGVSTYHSVRAKDKVLKTWDVYPEISRTQVTCDQQVVIPSRLTVEIGERTEGLSAVPQADESVLIPMESLSSTFGADLCSGQEDSDMWVSSSEIRFTINTQPILEWTAARIWAERAALDTHEGYVDFIAMCPRSPLANRARSQLDEIDWREAGAVGTVDSLKKYRTSHPTGSYVAEALDREAPLAWELLGKKPTADRLFEFATAYEGTDLASRAKLTAASIEWKGLARSRDEARFIAFAERYGAGIPQTQLAKTRVEEIRSAATIKAISATKDMAELERLYRDAPTSLIGKAALKQARKLRARDLGITRKARSMFDNKRYSHHQVFICSSQDGNVLYSLELTMVGGLDTMFNMTRGFQRMDEAQRVVNGAIRRIPGVRTVRVTPYSCPAVWYD